MISQQTPTHLKFESHGQESSQSKFSTMQSVPSTSSWAIDSLGIHTPSLQSESYYTNFLHHVRGSHTSNGEMSVEPILHAPQPRRNFTPIAPQPVDTPRITAAKRARDDEEVSDLFKRRRRSESTTSTQLELTEEDKLLLRLKEEESMPWKDIAARFQNDLGKQYQIPALQMRLKRLRERMRVWSDADVKALRMAHEYWAQNKFDLISQKASWITARPGVLVLTNFRCSSLALRKSGQLGSVRASGQRATACLLQCRNMINTPNTHLRRTL